MVDEDLAQLHLDVYDGREGCWHPERGTVTAPDGWVLLPSGDAFVTRRVKAAGVYWTLWRPKGRHRDHRRKIGVLAPAAAIEAARAEAEATEAKRGAQHVVGERARSRAEAAYREELAAAVVRWLDFDTEHAALAMEIALGAAEQAAVVGSGRVGRTKTLDLDERAALAARAFIRHRHTDYEAVLDRVDPPMAELDPADYLEIKRHAQQAVDALLAACRR